MYFLIFVSAVLVSIVTHPILSVLAVTGEAFMILDVGTVGVVQLGSISCVQFCGVMQRVNHESPRLSSELLTFTF